MRDHDKPGPNRGWYQHGTRQKYQGSRTVEGCRCDPCKQANAQYSRDMRIINNPSNRSIEEYYA